MNVAILTGAGGFIGARVARALLRQGWRVQALGRPRGPLSWPERMMLALDEIEGVESPVALPGYLSCHEADLTRPGLGLTPAARNALAAEPALLIHAAADTRFTPPDPVQQHRINTTACHHLLETLGERLTRAVFVSTAYVAGDRTGTARESETDAGQAFHNSYEQTKLAGELLFRETCETRSLPWVVVRPSIVINDRATGRASGCTPLGVLINLVGRLWERLGLKFGQVRSQVIRLMLDPATRPNLVPVDAVVAALLEIARHPDAAGSTCHLCHPAPQLSGEVISLLAEALGIAGKVRLEYQPRPIAPLSFTERMISHALQPYAPYLAAHCAFDLSQTRRLVPGYDALFRPLDLSYLQKVVAFQLARRRKTLALEAVG